jgi:nucleoid DNA-binding protein
VEKESDIMNKTELIKKVAAENGLSQKAAAAAVDSVLTSITDSLAAREPVTLIGFGTFTCRHRDARTGRNPATGKKIKIAASNTPIFKAGKAFKEKVN